MTDLFKHFEPMSNQSEQSSSCFPSSSASLVSEPITMPYSIDLSQYEVFEFTDQHKQKLINVLNLFIPEITKLESINDKNNLYWRLGSLVNCFNKFFDIFNVWPSMPNTLPLPSLVSQMSGQKVKSINEYLRIWLGWFYDCNEIIDSLGLESGMIEMTTMLVLNLFSLMRSSMPQVRLILDQHWGSLKDFDERLSILVRFDRITTLLLYQLENERIDHQMTRAKTSKMERMLSEKQALLDKSRATVEKLKMILDRMNMLHSPPPDSPTSNSLHQESISPTPHPGAASSSSNISLNDANDPPSPTGYSSYAYPRKRGRPRKNMTLMDSATSPDNTLATQICVSGKNFSEKSSISLISSSSSNSSSCCESKSVMVKKIKTTLNTGDCSSTTSNNNKTKTKGTSQSNGGGGGVVPTKKLLTNQSLIDKLYPSSRSGSPFQNSKPVDLSNLSVYYLPTSDQMIKCRLCARKFPNLSGFESHLVEHKSQRVFHCDWDKCNRFFMSNYKLKRHQRCHTGERPFKCSKCLKTFTRSDKLKDHLKIHLKNEKSNSTNINDTQKTAAPKPTTTTAATSVLKRTRNRTSLISTIVPKSTLLAEAKKVKEDSSGKEIKTRKLSKENAAKFKEEIVEEDDQDSNEVDMKDDEKEKKVVANSKTVVAEKKCLDTNSINHQEKNQKKSMTLDNDDEPMNVDDQEDDVNVNVDQQEENGKMTKSATDCLVNKPNDRDNEDDDGEEEEEDEDYVGNLVIEERSEQSISGTDQISSNVDDNMIQGDPIDYDLDENVDEEEKDEDEGKLSIVIKN